MRRYLFLLSVLALLAVNACMAGQDNSSKDGLREGFDYGKIHPDAPPETAALGQLVGNWDASMIRRNQDGTWSTDTTRAQWRWYYILEGQAIQDDWSRFDEEGNPYVGGTNIRIYNPEEKQWHMAWIDKTFRRLATFTAMNTDGKVIMTGHNSQGRLIRNIFLNITKERFDWQQQWTSDEGETWFNVAKILCRRKE